MPSSPARRPCPGIPGSRATGGRAPIPCTQAVPPPPTATGPDSRLGSTERGRREDAGILSMSGRAGLRIPSHAVCAESQPALTVRRSHDRAPRSVGRNLANPPSAPGTRTPALRPAELKPCHDPADRWGPCRDSRCGGYRQGEHHNLRGGDFRWNLITSTWILEHGIHQRAAASWDEVRAYSRGTLDPWSRELLNLNADLPLAAGLWPEACVHSDAVGRILKSPCAAFFA
jgi:hypothetical protein